MENKKGSQPARPSSPQTLVSLHYRLAITHV
nr:MAG TPA: hypothetical protein [Caudoviricetes sp.]